MPSHSESRILPYPADLMYAVVADVEKYPEFLPWVTSLGIVRRHDEVSFDARMCVGFAGFRECYVSRVILDPAAHAIDVEKSEGGPFRTLENHWRFTPLERNPEKCEAVFRRIARQTKDPGESCRVDFAVAFEFRNPLLNLVAGTAFQHAMLRMSAAFEARAKALSNQLS